MILRLASSDDAGAAHVGTQCRGYRYAAVRVLIGFEDRDERSSDRQGGAIQRVHELGPALLVAEARLHAARLERLEVAAR